MKTKEENDERDGRDETVEMCIKGKRQQTSYSAMQDNEICIDTRRMTYKNSKKDKLQRIH